MTEVAVSRPELGAVLGRRGPLVGLVPTLGALHDGHLSLISRARRDCEVVVVSVFVNPTQFSEEADFARYPRDLGRDVELAASAGADVVFAPALSEVYPDGDPLVTVDPGLLGEVLEGRSRPGHLRGVATVVTKLLAMVAPGRAYFGEKDYQQLLLVRRLVRDLSLPVEIVGCPTVRESDGLAASSRNALLSEPERAAATVLYRALLAGASVVTAGGSGGEAEAAMGMTVATEPLVLLDYAACRDAATLGEPQGGPLRLLVAGSLGSVRLIDNLGAASPGRG